MVSDKIMVNQEKIFSFKVKRLTKNIFPNNDEKTVGTVEIIMLSLTFQTPTAKTDIYKGSFFPHIIRDWNALLDTII